MSSVVKLVASLVQSSSLSATTVYSVPTATLLRFPSISATGPTGLNIYVKSESNPSILALPAASHVGSSISTMGASGFSLIINTRVALVTQPSSLVNVYVNSSPFDTL